MNGSCKGNTRDYEWAKGEDHMKQANCDRPENHGKGRRGDTENQEERHGVIIGLKGRESEYSRENQPLFTQE